MGKSLIKLAKANKNVVAITAAMPSGTGLDEFSKVCTDQFIDVGIAEQNAVTMAGGLAKEGIKPYVCVYSTFLQRAYDQIVHDICLQNLDVVFCIDRAGLVGEDGETHHGMFDISYLSHIPNITILAPKDKFELEQMISYSYNHKGPLAIRYPRGNAIEINKATFNLEPEVLSEGEILVLAVGKMVHIAIDVVNELKEQNIKCKLINPRQLIPMTDSLVQLVKDAKHVVTIEDHTIVGGYGHYVSLMANRTVEIIALPCEFVEHGSVDLLHEKHGLDKESIVNRIKMLRSLNG
jgi:1-deoxy-D-xylulose-5-phosphate synthase